MKIIEAQSNEQLSTVIQGNDVCVYLNERQEEITRDGITSVIFKYDAVIVENGVFSTNVEKIAGNYYWQNYLNQTDWITAKYHDCVTVGSMGKADFVAKYSELYANREKARAFLNQGE